MIKLNMFLLAIALTLATTVAFTVTAPKTGSTTALNSYYGMDRYRGGYGTTYDRHDRYDRYSGGGGRNWNRYDDDMYGDYASGGYSRRYPRYVIYRI